MITRGTIVGVFCERCPEGPKEWTETRDEAVRLARTNGWGQITGKTAYRGDWLCERCYMEWESEDAIYASRAATKPRVVRLVVVDERYYTQAALASEKDGDA